MFVSADCKAPKGAVLWLCGCLYMIHGDLTVSTALFHKRPSYGLEIVTVTGSLDHRITYFYVTTVTFTGSLQ